MRTALLLLGALTLVACNQRPCATAKCPEVCLDDTGRTSGGSNFADRAPAQAGTCGTVSCSEGCTCSKDSAGMPACLCTGALPPSGFLCVSAPNCGVITCGSGCSCADAGVSTCACT